MSNTKTNDNRRLIIDTWTTNNYRVCNESEIKTFQNESSFQSIYSNIQNNHSLSPKVLCVIEGRWSKDNAVSVNGRYYGEFWRKQLAKEQTQYLLRKGLMYMMFGHVDRGIEDKDVEDGTVAGIVTHLRVLDAPETINGRQYDKDDLFGRAIIIEMGGKNAGLSTYTLLSVGSEISISSRGLGEYLVGETHTLEDGRQIPIMNPDTYELETFDFTRLPGISVAEVHMVKDNLVPGDMPNNGIIDAEEDGDDEIDFDAFESQDIPESTYDLINESLQTLIFNMRKKENEMPKIDGNKVHQTLENANAEITELRRKLEDAEQAKADAEKERDDAKAKADELEKELADSKSEAIEAGTQPEEEKQPAEEEKEAKEDAPKPAETPVVDTTKMAEVQANQAINDELERFKAIADTPEKLSEVLLKASESIKSCECDAKDLKDTKEKLEAAEEEIEEKDKDIEALKEALESYTKLGSIADLSAMIESNQALRNEARKQKYVQFVEHYSVKKGITQESVKRIVESSKSVSDAKKILESLPNVNPNKGLYKPEGKQTSKKESTGFATFAESMINRMESRRKSKSYSA